jgi:hypothetical protein
MGYMGSEFDARLALAEIEMKAGQNSGGTTVPDRDRDGRKNQRLQPHRTQGRHCSRLSIPLKQGNASVLDFVLK